MPVYPIARRAQTVTTSAAADAEPAIGEIRAFFAAGSSRSAERVSLKIHAAPMIPGRTIQQTAGSPPKAINAPAISGPNA